VDDIRMDFVEIEWGGVVWIGQPHDREKWRILSNAVTNHRVA
jgi:hypothetical protein